MTDGTLVLTARDVANLLDLRACIDGVEAALCDHEAGHSLGPTSLGLMLPNGSFHVKAAGLSRGGRSFIAAKANVNLPGNPARHGRPTIQGVLILADAEDGRPVAVMDSTVITTVRTGATTAVAARHLALPDADTITIVGCGEQGRIQLQSIAAVRRLKRAWAIDIDRDKARAYAREMSAELGFAIDATDDLRGSIARSQMCVTCTTSHAPVLTPDCLHPGLFIAAVGADNPGKQELDPRVLPGGKVVVDSLDACATGGELHHALEARVMTRDEVHGELSGVVVGRVQRRSAADEIFVFDSTGTALQDVAAAVLVYTNAIADGSGINVPLGAR
jgi:alanine dehydrogenase